MPRAVIFLILFILVIVGLLVLAEYLCVQRLRNVFLTPER